jgi:hypothetical protein
VPKRATPVDTWEVAAMEMEAFTTPERPVSVIGDERLRGTSGTSPVGAARRTGVSMFALMLSIVGIGCTGGSSPQLAVEDAGRPSRLDFYYSGGLEDVVEYMMGELSPSDSLVSFAACSNVPDWRKDRSLDLAIIVGKSGRLTRALEIVESDESMRAAVEDVMTEEVRARLSENSDEVNFSAAQLELQRQIEEPPSPATVENVVAFAVRVTLSDVRISVLDRRGVDLEGLSDGGKFVDMMTTLFPDGPATKVASCDL